MLVRSSRLELCVHSHFLFQADNQAIGPRTWFSEYAALHCITDTQLMISGRYGTNQTTGAIVQNNVFSGAMVYAMVRSSSLVHLGPIADDQGVSGVKDTLLQNNSFTGNVSFVCPSTPHTIIISLHVAANPRLGLMARTARQAQIPLIHPPPFYTNYQRSRTSRSTLPLCRPA